MPYLYPFFLFQIKFEIEAVAIGFFLLWLWFRRILQVALLVKHIVCSAKYDELGAAVQLIADFLMLLALLEDKLLGEFVALLEPRIFLGQLLANLLWSLLAISHWGKALLLDAMGYQVIYYRLGTALRQPLVVFGISLVIAMALSSMVTFGFSFSNSTSLSSAWCWLTSR